MTMSEQTAFDSPAAESILRRACILVRLDPDGVEMLRLGDYAVFRIDGGRVVSRVGRHANCPPSAHR